ncbi:MAG: C45 family peptidase [Atribacterota bacterium]
MLSMITMEGRPEEIGMAHGTQFKEQIHRAYQELCQFGDILSAKRKVVLVKRYLDHVSATFPDLLEEMQGIALGAEMSLESIGELTLWEELKALAMDPQDGVPHGCTSVCFLNTPDGTVVGKTTDIEDFQRPYYVLQHLVPQNGYRLIGLGKIGSTKIEVGLNEKGLCIATGSLAPLEQDVDGIERMTLVRLALERCSNVDEAITFISRHHLIRLGLYFLLADPIKACVIEKSTIHQGFRFPSHQGTLFATNFYLTPHMAPLMNRNAFYYQNALERYANLSILVETGLPAQGLSGMKTLLRNHSALGPVCAHFNDLGMCSFYACIILPQTLRFLLADGFPCQTEFQAFSIQVHHHPQEGF